MPLNFADDIEELATHLKSILEEDPYLPEDLEAALSTREFTDAQIKIIKNNATPTTFHNTEEGEALESTAEEILTHSFADPVRNGILMMSFNANNPQSSFSAMVNIRRAINDITHNYPLLLGEDIPRCVDDVLNSYESKIIPELNDLIDDMEDEHGFDAEKTKPTTDWQHISKLPIEPFYSIPVPPPDNLDR